MGERDDLKEVQVDNALVKCYVNCVSDTYSIADPFQFADSETTLTKTRKTKVEDYQGRHNEYEHTPIKSLQMK